MEVHELLRNSESFLRAAINVHKAWAMRVANDFGFFYVSHLQWLFYVMTWETLILSIIKYSFVCLWFFSFPDIHETPSKPRFFLPFMCQATNKWGLSYTNHRSCYGNRLSVYRSCSNVSWSAYTTNFWPYKLHFQEETAYTTHNVSDMCLDVILLYRTQFHK